MSQNQAKISNAFIRLNAERICDARREGAGFAELDGRMS